MRLEEAKREDPVPGVVTDWTATWSTMDFMDCLDADIPGADGQTEQKSGCCTANQREKYVKHFNQNGLKDQRVCDPGCSCGDSDTVTFSGDGVGVAGFDFGNAAYIDGFVFAEEVLSSALRNSNLSSSAVSSSADPYNCAQNIDSWGSGHFPEKDQSAGASHSSGSSPSHENSSATSNVKNDKSKGDASSSSNQSSASAEGRKKPVRSNLSQNSRKESKSRTFGKDKNVPSTPDPAKSPPLPEENEETWGDVLKLYFRYLFGQSGKASAGFRLPVPPRRIPRRKRRNDETPPELVWPNWSIYYRKLLTVGTMIAVWLWSLINDTAHILWRIFQILLGVATLAAAVLYIWLVEAFRLLRQRWKKWRGKDLPELPKSQTGPSMANIALPTTGDEAVSRLLTCQNKDPYSILGVSRKASDDEIKKYYRRQAVLVHPDKNPTKGAEEAFKILAHAFDLIGEPFLFSGATYMDYLIGMPHKGSYISSAGYEIACLCLALFSIAIFASVLLRLKVVMGPKFPQLVVLYVCWSFNPLVPNYGFIRSYNRAQLGEDGRNPKVRVCRNNAPRQEKRLQYDNASLESEHMEAAWRDFEDLLSKLHAKMEEVANTIQCTSCGKRHQRIPTERPCYSARYCATCKTHHAARNGDIWAESTYLGFKWHYYACMDSAIFDVTEWAACQTTMLKHLQSNSHNIQYRIVSNKKPKPSKANLSSEPEMEDFMNLFYGGAAGAGSPQPPPPSDGAGSFKSNLKKKNKKKKR